jgi:hypothetical protein
MDRIAAAVGKGAHLRRPDWLQVTTLPPESWQSLLQGACADGGSPDPGIRTPAAAELDFPRLPTLLAVGYRP